MTNNRSFRTFSSLLITLAFSASAHAGQTDISTDPLNTYSAPSSTDVKPNVFMVLDDSGSMNWDFMPDWACSPTYSTRSGGDCSSAGQTASSADQEYLFRNAGYNGIYYNPAVVYKPPVAVDSTGAVNSTTFPSMTGADSTTGANSGTKPNWKAVGDDAYGVQSSLSSTSDLQSTPQYFYTTVAGEYCTSASLRKCITASAATTVSGVAYNFPAVLRWCDSSALTNCQAAFSSNFSYARAPSPRTTSFSVSSILTGATVSSIKVNGLQILSGAVTAASTSSSNMAAAIAASINACNGSISGICGVAGYGATASGSVVTITAGINTVATPVLSKTGTITLSSPAAFSTSPVPGYSLLAVITAGTVAVFPFPGQTGKAVTRTDCAGTLCTGNEEMTNYANWWTYYKSRMQMMKTSASNAFAAIDKATDIANGVSRFRVGYMSINNNTGGDFVNLAEFTGAQKYNWYNAFTSAIPGNSTPLRAALSKAGRLYAGKLNGQTLNGSTVVDPLQYSCQQNYTILSTDGFWNENSGFYKMNGSTSVGNQDAGLPRPYYDGGSAQIQSSTSNLQSQTVTPQPQTSTSTLQSQTISPQWQTSTNQLQSDTQQLQKRTSSNSGSKWTSWANATSCIPVTSGKNQTQCQTLDSGWVAVTSCTASSTSSTTISCQYAGWSAYSNSSPNSCTAVAPSTGPTSYSVGTAVQCQTSGVVLGTWQTASSCTASSASNCRYTAWTAYNNTASCTPTAQSVGPAYTVGTAYQCQSGPTPILGTWVNASSCTASSTSNCQYTAWSTPANASSCTALAQSTAPNYTVGTAMQCSTVNSGGTSNTLADVAAYYYNTDLRSSDTTQGTGTCTGPTISPSTTPNDLCADNVPSNGRDVATTQHMTTFTLGLGSQGQMIYAPTDGKDYWNDTSGDFYDVYKGTTANTSAGICSWQTSGVCNWPTPASNSNTNIDDLWHAAVNGHGTYFSAANPSALANGLTSALATIINTPRPGTAAAAASSNPNVSAADNYVFSSSYKSVDWYGELIRQQLSTTGTLGAQNWSAMTLLDCATTPWRASTSYIIGNVFRQGTNCYTVVNGYSSGTTFNGAATGVDGMNTKVVNVDGAATTPVAVTAPTSRTIYTKGTIGSTTGLITFDWATLQSAGLDSNFTAPHISYVSGAAPTGLTQFCTSGGNCLSSAAQSNNTIATGGASGEALVNFLRGDRSNEGTYFRTRAHVLGDIVSSEARYVQTPLFSYADTNYAAFKTSSAITSRVGAVYVGANDGMVHAFDASSGKELWAYIPSMVLPNMYNLADKNYATLHQFFVDNSPETGDICPNAPASTCTSAQWKSILVGGLNRGGKGYYALDVTDPTTPKLLWEFTNTNLGYSYGNPKITKLSDGTWVVLLSSGYNNADGLGHLYVLNANTGATIRDIVTSAGSTATPSGMARISAHSVQALTDNTSIAAYGGDTLGNLWRFDINGNIGASGYDAQLLVSFKDAAGNPQPITAAPLEATVNGNPVVYVGTGRYLGTTDVADTSIESFYAVLDKSDANTYTNPRVPTSTSKFVQQTLTAKTCPANSPVSLCTPGQVVRTSSNNPVDWTTNTGWYIDFLTGGERASTDPSLALGTLVFTTITPQVSTVSACGATDPNVSGSFLYALNYLTGAAVDGASGVSGFNLGASLVTRPVMIEQADGTVRVLIRSANGTSTGTDLGGTIITTPPIKPSATSNTRRVSWRVLTTQ
ncbi:pilus assembly protein [Collimonas arenae]|uniref:pilus assembly protein n=1 Tax=Collimonas arenae TaxID=279058 RepID=UPI00155AA56F|nr:PilC/PilY family type IV pilus protein [Collimonas arenae]